MLPSGEELLGSEVTVTPDSGQIALGFVSAPTPESGEVIMEVFLGHPSLPEPYYKLVVMQSSVVWGLGISRWNRGG